MAQNRNTEHVRFSRGALLLSGAFLLTAGCGAGQYGFSKTYSPSSEEEPFHEEGEEVPYKAVNQDPSDYEGKLIAWFGVVEEVSPADDGRYLVRLQHRKHKERHLCGSDADSSCRVTVHFKSSGTFSVHLDLRPEDVVPGLDKVQPGTLLRVFGKVRCRENDEEEMECDYNDLGGVLLDGLYYRQWPARYFVTTRSAAALRR